jgi:hypothetical protein
MRLSGCVRIFACALALVLPVAAQSPNGNINGSVQDPANGVIVAAEVVLVNDVTGVQYTTKTNNEGIFVLPNLPPGPYRIQVSKLGFKTIVKPDIVLNVQDALSLNFTLPVGAAYEILTVEGGAPLVNTENGTVSTVVDRQFAENLPMNGRSFQTLIYLTPGVVPTITTADDAGQFSVNGQRPTSNYWMVDGVSANVGVGVSSPGNGLGGTLGSFTAMGGTNSLVSVDAMQEFRIQTSTFAPEFGRTPGGQISILTRSGTNQFHGTAFDYLRNDVFDANNWFADSEGLPKPMERQNDFGATLGGPIVRKRTFFFFSYEGLRLRLPQTTLTTVPDLTARANAVAAIQPYLVAFPKPNGSDDQTAGIAQFNASYSNPARLNAYSLRVDHKLNSSLTLFGRYNYSPSSVSARGANGSAALSSVEDSRIAIQTVTLGAIWGVSPLLANELRFNYSRTNAESVFDSDSFGGANPLPSLPIPSPYSSLNGKFDLSIRELSGGGSLQEGKQGQNIQRQINVVDNVSLQAGSHSIKLGVDFRRLSPIYAPFEYSQLASFQSVATAEMGNSRFGSILKYDGATFLFEDLSLFAQDAWRVRPRLSLTYGIRWDVDFAPSSLDGPSIPAVTGYSLTDFSKLTIQQAGASAFKTRYHNFAPRLGVAYQIANVPDWPLVLRGGVGVFYDLVSTEAGNLISGGAPPFGNISILFGQTFPFTASQIAPPVVPATATLANLFAFNPNLKSPYAVEWSIALEQSLGKNQTVSASYLGAAGHRLLQTTTVGSPPMTNPNLEFGLFADNTAVSNYNALQLQFHRRLSQGLQILTSYTWSHSIDNASASSFNNSSNLGVPGSPGENRGASDFDIRNALTAGVTYEIPTPQVNNFCKAVMAGWSVSSFVFAHSAAPVDLTDVNFFDFNSGIQADIRPDIVPGQPFYLYGSQYPGREAYNSSAFTDPPVDPTTKHPTRQGTAPRNLLRGFGAAQWDFGVHRDFRIHDSSLKLQFRGEMFNFLNHPNFGPPSGSFGFGGFGRSTTTLAQSLAGGAFGGGGGGAFSPLYQIGGPRSIQVALKLLW